MLNSTSTLPNFLFLSFILPLSSSSLSDMKKIQPVMFALEPLAKDMPQLLPQLLKVGLHMSSLKFKFEGCKTICKKVTTFLLPSLALSPSLPLSHLLPLPTSPPHRSPFSTNWNKKPTVSLMTTTPWRTFLPLDTSDLVSQLTPSSTICCGGTAPRGPSRRRS